jgi:hypothetical protein
VFGIGVVVGLDVGGNGVIEPWRRSLRHCPSPSKWLIVLDASVGFQGKLVPMMVTFIGSYGGDKVYINGMGVIDLMLSRLWALALRPVISQLNNISSPFKLIVQ